MLSDSCTVGQESCESFTLAPFHPRTLLVPKPWSFDDSHSPFFCTDVIVGWQYVFTSPEFFLAIIDSLQYCRDKKGLRLHGYVIMPNHVHSIVSATDGNLASIIRDYKRHTSWKILELLGETRNRRLLKYFHAVAKREERGNEHKIWQSGSHPILIESDGFFEQKLQYLHNNPVVKGYVERPEDWKFSSARNYELGDHSIIKIDSLE
jgi:putative transposase